MRAPLQVMSGILDALLDISMLDSGMITPKPENFALRTILERVATDLRPLAEQKRLSFDFEETAVSVNSDPALLERIVENLVSNAIRYTTEGSVSVRAESIGDSIRISVADTGIGIPEQAIERIFDEYFQFDNPARNIKKGLGLGLAIVKRLTQLLNHPINVRSTLGGGSIFSVDVPLAQEASLSEKRMEDAAPTESRRQLAVLFIDDDSAVADSLFMVLAAAGFKAVGAGDGNEAVARLEEGLRPDVVLSDYRMPSENGLEVITRLRQALGRNTPAIVMTGDTSLRHIEGQKIVNLQVVQKPVAPDVLIALIHEIADRPNDASSLRNR